MRQDFEKDMGQGNGIMRQGNGIMGQGSGIMGQGSGIMGQGSEKDMGQGSGIMGQGSGIMGQGNGIMRQGNGIMGQGNGIMRQDNETSSGKPNGILEQGSGTIFGYGRVSTKEQNSARQREVLQNKCDVYFEDKMSGRNMERPEFQKMMEQLRPGDMVMVVSIDRLGRNLKELVELSSKLKEMGVNIVAINQGIDTHTKMGELFYNLMAIFADLELEFIKERQRAGIEVAKKEGRYKGRPARQLKDWEQISQEFENKELSIDRACKLLGISRSSFYRRKRLEEMDKKISTISDNAEIDF